MRYLTTEEYLHTPRPQLQWLIQGLLPTPGMLEINGPAKEGKSFLAYDLARCVSQGVPFLGHSTIQTRALYLQFDTSETVWRDRLLTIQAKGIDISGPLYMIHPEDMMMPFNILTREGKEWLTQVVRELDPGLTVIDVLREIHTGDENDSTVMKLVGDALSTIFANRTLVIVHHTRKLNPEFSNVDPASAGRGSSYVAGKVDSIWLLWQKKLHIQPRFAESRVIKGSQSDSGLWVFRQDLTSEELIGEILSLCEQSPQLSHNALFQLAEDNWGVSRSTYYRILSDRACAHTRQAQLKGGLNLIEQPADQLINS